VDHLYEADDLIGTLAQQATAHGIEVVVVSNDKDLMQLVTPQVTFYDAARDRRLDAAGVMAYLGVQPAQIPDLLALQGDAVDNIPGVKGIGTKTAVALLRIFPDLETLYADLASIESLPLRNTKTLRQKLATGQEAAFLSKRLATIALDAPVICDLSVLEYRGGVRSAVTPLFEDLGFRRLAQRITHWNA
jgi:DNA polymerase-1